MYFGTIFRLIDSIFCLVFKAQSANANTIIFANFMHISNSDGQFYAFKIKFSCKNFANFTNSYNDLQNVNIWPNTI